MSNVHLRESLMAQATSAFLSLSEHINELLDVAADYSDTHPVKTRSDRIKTDQLGIAVQDMSRLYQLIANEVDRWKREDDPIVSKLGVELEYLNELNITIRGIMMFFIMENMKLRVFDLSKVNRAHAELVRCNRLL